MRRTDAMTQPTHVPQFMHSSPIENANIALLLWRAADLSPRNAAIVERETPASYGELRVRAASVAAELTRRGIRPGDRVGILLDRGADAAAAFFGVAAAGALAININETLRPRQIEYILQHSRAAALITGPALLARQPRALESAASVLLMNELAVAEFEPVVRVNPDFAQIVYTSGSTGLPKGVTLMHQNLWAGARAVAQYVEITAADRIASLLPFSFDYGFNQLLCAVATGATLVVETSPLVPQIVTTLREREITVLPCVPPLWLQLLRTPSFTEQPLPALRAMTNTGGRIPVDGVRHLRRSHPNAKLFLMYGLTEAFRATYVPPELVDEHPDAIGRAIPGTEIMVLRDDLTPCDVNEVGELVQRGATVSAGYWSDPVSTAAVFRPHPLRAEDAPDSERVVFSGDLVRRDANGILFYVGRRDNLIKSLGFRVSPDEVADVIYSSGHVAECVVTTEANEERGDAIVAYVVLNPDGAIEHVHRFCRAEMPRYMQPSRIDAVAEIPRTTSGKFDVRNTVRT
jgi:amino acid adenylation domain-containing protein